MSAVTTTHHPETSLGGDLAVLIPVFQDDGRLQATLASVATQHVPCTVVVVDDGSTPPLTVATGHLPFPVVLLRLEHNRGIETALNTGLSWIRAHGFRYIARLDNGDRSLPGRLLAQRTFLETHAEVGLVGTAVVWETAATQPVFTLRPPTSNTALQRAFHDNCPLIHPSVCFRTALLDQVGLYRLDVPAAEDYDLFWRMARLTQVACLPDVLVATRFDPAGISHTRRQRQLRSRFAIQRRHATWTRVPTYLGLAKTLVLMLTPHRLVVFLKRILRPGGARS